MTIYVFLLEKTTISWANKKQTTIAFSLTKAKHMACTQAMKDVL
jgi:hypothetical protein